MKNDYKDMKDEELVSKRNELKKKFFDLRFKMVVEHVDNKVQKRTLRRDIARLETMIRARELKA